MVCAGPLGKELVASDNTIDLIAAARRRDHQQSFSKLMQRDQLSLSL